MAFFAAAAALAPAFFAAAGRFIKVTAFQGEMSRITVRHRDEQIHLRMHVWARL